MQKAVRTTISGTEFPLLNLMPHPIVIFASQDGGQILATIPSHGQARLTRALVTQQSPPILLKNGEGGSVEIPIKYGSSWNGIESDDVDLLKKNRGNVIIVSLPVAEYMCAHQEWAFYTILVPDTGPDGVVRNQSGQICGVTRLIMYQKC